jgi:hypothetical protein
MKKILLLISMMGGLAVIAQTQTGQGQIWLTNSRGENFGEADTLVPAKFFATTKINLSADFIIDKTMDCWLIIQPVNNPDGASAYKFVNREFPPETLPGLAAQQSGTRVTVLVQPARQQEGQTKGNKIAFKLK